MPLTPKELEALERTFIEFDDKRLTFKGLIFGLSGVGKTVEAMEMAQIVTPPDKEIMFIDTSDGWVSLMNHPQLMRRTKPMSYKGLSQLKMLVTALEGRQGSFANVGTIVFDEISTTAKRDLPRVYTATGLGEYEAAEFKHYNIATRRMEDVLSEIIKLRESHNLIFVSHMKERENKRTGIKMREPSVMPAFGETLKEALHVVAFMQADIKHGEKDKTAKYYWTMQVHPSRMTTAKTRIGGLDVIVTPKVFNDRLRTWITREDNRQEIEEREPVELAEEKRINADVDDQTTFSGYEVGDD